MGTGVGWTVSSSDLWAPQRWKSPLTVRRPTPDVPLCVPPTGCHDDRSGTTFCTGALGADRSYGGPLAMRSRDLRVSEGLNPYSRHRTSVGCRSRRSPLLA
jgi:hypothetical protein